LGLAVVHGVVEQYGGFVEIDSTPGRGTTVRVYLPAVGDSAVDETPRPKASVLPRGNETILVVEDEPAVRALAVRVLKSAGYTALEAGGATQALLVAGRHRGPIHLLLTDVVMPWLSGRKVAEVMVQEYLQLRVLYMSGYTGDGPGRDTWYDRVAFLQKPFAPAALARKVREVLDAEVAVTHPADAPPDDRLARH
jgi:CheY-like chemotaxis protein